MLPYVQIGSVTISMYALMIVAGIGVGCAVMRRFTPIFGIKKDDALFAALFAVFGAAIGGKLAYLLVSLPAAGELNWETVARFLKAGYVYYGGLAGAVLGVWIYCKCFKLPFYAHLNGTIVALPLIHAFGRVGCFFAGCCYGIAYDGPLSVTFHASASAPNGVAIFPVQLLEALLNLCLFVALCLVFHSRERAKRISCAGVYLCAYACIRFCVEFLRADAVRGVWGGLSTSQWCSIPVLAIGIWLILRDLQIEKNGRAQREAPAQP